MAKFGKRRGKFNNTRCEFDGKKFDSKKEMERYKFLMLKEEAGEIEGLFVHPCFSFADKNGDRIVIKGEKRNTTARYTADFQYILTRDGRKVIEDVKSKPTAKDGGFKLRRALFEYLYGVDLELVFKPDEWKWG